MMVVNHRKEELLQGLSIPWGFFLFTLQETADNSRDFIYIRRTPIRPGQCSNLYGKTNESPE